QGACPHKLRACLSAALRRDLAAGQLPLMVTPDKMMVCGSSLAAIDGVRHGFFTRQGGVSSGVYASLNCGPGSRDDAANVAENRARVAEILGVKPDRLLSLPQQHSAEALTVKKPWDAAKQPQADAMVTATPGLALGVLTADCAPVLFADGEAGFITDEGSGEPHFDLPGYVAERLARAGVGSIADLGLCTYCEETRLFSYRRSQHHGEEDYGRQISAIVVA